MEESVSAWAREEEGNSIEVSKRSKKIRGSEFQLSLS
jgi:hypothetical protein